MNKTNKNTNNTIQTVKIHKVKPFVKRNIGYPNATVVRHSTKPPSHL